MNVTSGMVKELREKTGAGMMDCKNALMEAKGNMVAAFEVLRKKGVATAAKKASRTAADGLIGHSTSGDGRLGVLVEVNCETDFVTKLEDFQNYVGKIVKAVAEKNPKDMGALLALPMDNGTVSDVQTALLAKIGENLGVRRFVRIAIDGPRKLAQYIHMGSKIGVMVAYDDPSGKLDDQNAREVAMHVAAMHPQYVRRDDVTPEILEKEKEIIKAQMGDVKKPPEILDKIITGKLGKFFTEVCLDDQIYVKDPEGKSSVSAWLKKIDGGIRVREFVRLQVGEGVEK